MGLDQWIEAEYNDGDGETFASFRKVNFLHGFFDEVVGLDEEWRYAYLEEEHVKELYIRCEKVIDILRKIEPDEHGIFTNKKVVEEARKLLPPTPGFFFGSYDIDIHYLDDVKDVRNVAEEILEEFDFDKGRLLYDTWW